jgi:hypothetical protein
LSFKILSNFVSKIFLYCKSKSKFKREARRSLEKELQDLSSQTKV